MIRIEGIPVVAARLRRAQGTTQTRPSSRIVAAGKAIVAIRYALQVKAKAA